VVEETIRYIDELHKALAAKLQSKTGFVFYLHFVTIFLLLFSFFSSFSCYLVFVLIIIVVVVVIVVVVLLLLLLFFFFFFFLFCSHNKQICSVCGFNIRL